jgi:AAA+ ATPase superfamily predicted ATPase
MVLIQSYPISPYIVGKPVPPDKLIGYRPQIIQFFRHLQETDMTPLRILGLRRSGKTSFLKYLASDIWQKNNSFPEELNAFNVIYFDSTQVNTAIEFYSFIIEEIWKKMPSNNDYPPAIISDAHTFKLWFEKFIYETNSNVIVLLDEFENLILNNNIDGDFFGLLRYMASASDYSDRFTWVIASCKDINFLSEERNIKETVSPFWNVFSPEPIILGGLSTEEAKDLIRKPALSVGIAFTDKEINEIYRISGKIPYMIQAIASGWFSMNSTDLLFANKSQSLLKKYSNLQSIIKIFEGYWRWMTEEQQRYMHSLANGKRMNIPEGSILCLADFGLIENTDKGYEISGELLRMFLQAKKIEIPNSLIILK